MTHAVAFVSLLCRFAAHASGTQKYAHARARENFETIKRAIARTKNNKADVIKRQKSGFVSKPAKFQLVARAKKRDAKLQFPNSRYSRLHASRSIYAKVGAQAGAQSANVREERRRRFRLMNRRRKRKKKRALAYSLASRPPLIRAQVA